MRRVPLLAAASAAVLLAACGIGAPSYPQFGEGAYRIEGMTTPVNGGAPTRTVIYRDGPKMRVEAVLAGYGDATVVFDASTNAAYVLNPISRPAMAAPQAAPQAGASAEATGVAVRIDDANAPQPMETAWAALGQQNARSTGRCEAAGEQGREWTPREAPAPGIVRTACITDDGIVLRVSEDGRVLWEATSVQRGQQDASLFGVPAGYQLIDPQGAAAAVTENLEHLDSVTGAPPQQAPAPRG